MKKKSSKKTSSLKKLLSPSGKKLVSRSSDSSGVKKSSSSGSAKKSSSAKKPSTRPASGTGSHKKSHSSSISNEKYPSKELKLIILSVITIVLFLSYYLNSFGIIGRFLQGIGAFFLGGMFFTVPLFFLAFTIHIFMRGTITPYKHKYVFAAIGIVCVAALTTLIDAARFPNLYSGSFANLETTIGATIKDRTQGGVIGALITLPLRPLIGNVGTGVILAALILVSFVIITGKQPLIKFAKFMSGYVSEFIANRRADKDEEYDEDDIVISGVEEEEEKPKKRIRRSTEDRRTSFQDEEKNGEDSEFRINLYDDKKDNKSDSAKPVEIPDNIRKMAMEESGGVGEGKEDTTPIAVTEEEIETDYIEYTFPPVDLLMKAKSPSGGQDKPEDLRTQAKKLVDTLASFGVEAKVLEVSKGPSVTRFELQPSAGVKVSKIVNLADDIALNLAAFGVRIEAPIPGKAAVGIEIPNKSTSMVALRDVIESEQFRSFDSKTAFAMGKDISGEPVISDISKMPHMLIAGATGSGKSVCINSLITSILYKADPNQVKLILIDPKVVELGVYNGIPHLLIPVVTDPRRAAGALNWAVQEMVKRYSMFATANVRDIKGYNEYAALSGDRQLEQIIIVIDELADLMMVSPHEVEDSICRLAQMARAAGMHLVIATQRPSVDVITGLIKANVPSRIAFSVSSQIDSRTILDMGGAEKLLGKGDMLFLPMGASKPKRLQGAFVSDKEIERIVEFVKSDSTAHYNEDIIEHIENGSEDHSSGDDSDADDLLPHAIEIVVEIGQASASLLQRKLKVGYSRAGRLIDQLEERGIIGPHEGSKPRKVLMSRSEFQEMMVNNIED